MSEIPQIERGSVGKGIGLAIASHLAQFIIVPIILFGGAGGIVFAMATWGLTQFLYLGPLAWVFHQNGESNTVKGILITAGIGFLLNGACDTLFLAR